MTCQRIAGAIVCGPTPRRKCSVRGCGRREQFLCDWPVGHGTCDRGLCHEHRVSQRRGVDYCPEHARAGQLLLDLGDAGRNAKNEDRMGGAQLEPNRRA
jgi:hypothetical protein